MRSSLPESQDKSLFTKYLAQVSSFDDGDGLGVTLVLGDNEAPMLGDLVDEAGHNLRIYVTALSSFTVSQP